MQQAPAATGAGAPDGPRWRVLLRPRWLAWHLFAVAAVASMIWLGDWQLRRAESGNPLSWAYTFEWPVFAVFGVVFWIKTVRDELHPRRAGEAPPQVPLPPGAGRPSGDRQAGQAGAAAAGGDAGGAEPDEPADAELAEYNAYLAKLNAQVRGHGRWHGLR